MGLSKVPTFLAFLLGEPLEWWLAAGQSSTPPVIRPTNSGSSDSRGEKVTGLDRSLAEAGYVDGQNVTLEYRRSEDHYDRLPEFAAELIVRLAAIPLGGGGRVPAPGARTVR